MSKFAGKAGVTLLLSNQEVDSLETLLQFAVEESLAEALSDPHARNYKLRSIKAIRLRDIAIIAEKLELPKLYDTAILAAEAYEEPEHWKNIDTMYEAHI